MTIEAIERLLLKVGQKPGESSLRQLETQVVRQTQFRGGRNVRHRVLPWGTITHYDGGAGGFTESEIFLPEVTMIGGTYEIRWLTGRIGGRVPTIGGSAIDESLSGGKTPALVCSNDVFDAAGRARIYFRVTLDSDFEISRIEPIASATDLRDNKTNGHRLSLVLYQDGTFWRALHTNQGYTAAKHRGNGGVSHFFTSDF